MAASTSRQYTGFGRTGTGAGGGGGPTGPTTGTALPFRSAPQIGASGATQQHREAQRLDRERVERAERERIEREGRGQLEQLSEEQREEIDQAFALFDLDKDNYIDYHELKVAMKALGFDLPKSEILTILQTQGIPANDTKAAGKAAVGSSAAFTGTTTRLLLPLESFQALMASRILARDPRDEILRAFELFDEGGKGKITHGDLKRVARELGEGLQEEELRAMIDEFDMDGDGAIDRDEFLSICLG
ncbi:MAG: Calcium-binding component of the spindle pole body (SPB) half-bridge [Bogoriella megaspora]|nr:MAG: Calcium-binding component of the spindle pole body (SPB) half-bridge [Bogoriella megaspora]